MLNNGNKTNCGFFDEIVAYIYDETGAADRTKFETHLTGCTVCTDEFAAISNARFSVFEWQKEEFAHLSTPEIVIPYAAKKDVIEGNASAGYLSGLRGLLSLVNVPVAVAAVLMMFLGLGFLAMTYIGRGEQQIASNINVPPVEVPNTPNISKVDETKTPEVGVTNTTTNKTSQQEVRPSKTVEYRHPKIERQMTANNPVNKNLMPQVRKAPVLSNFDDNDDRSLRLADLFEEVGGVRK